MQDLTGSTRCVLLDFDGPVCALFSAHPAHAIARALERLSTGNGTENGMENGMENGTESRTWAGPVVGTGPGTDDPYVVLRAAFEDPGTAADGTAEAVERLLTREEVVAASGARPTDDADTVIHALHEAGHALAVATNNSRESVECYLTRRGLMPLFEGHVHGRLPGGPPRLKPDPDCLLRALESTGARAADAVMVGDHPRDLAAAQAAGVGFVGYARDAHKAAQLRAAGATAVAGSLGRVLELLDPRAYAEARIRLRAQVA